MDQHAVQPLFQGELAIVDGISLAVSDLWISIFTIIYVYNIYYTGRMYMLCLSLPDPDPDPDDDDDDDEDDDDDDDDCYYFCYYYN